MYHPEKVLDGGGNTFKILKRINLTGEDYTYLREEDHHTLKNKVCSHQCLRQILSFDTNYPSKIFKGILSVL